MFLFLKNYLTFSVIFAQVFNLKSTKIILQLERYVWQYLCNEK